MSHACNFIKKETLAQVFSCDICEISKNTFFTEHLWTTASKYSTFRQKKLYSHTFKPSLEEVIVMHSEKMQAKYIIEDVLKSLFRKLVGWHLAMYYR